jgi:hypothetical protein
MGFVDQFETDRTQKVHILLLNETGKLKKIQIKRKNVRLTSDRVQVVRYQRPILSRNTVQIKVKMKKKITSPTQFFYFILTNVFQCTFQINNRYLTWKLLVERPKIRLFNSTFRLILRNVWCLKRTLLSDSIKLWHQLCKLTWGLLGWSVLLLRFEGGSFTLSSIFTCLKLEKSKVK